MTALQAIIEIINSEETFSREDLLQVGGSEKTIDTYRNKLQAIGFIETISRGQFKRVKMIPENYNSTQLKEDHMNRGEKIELTDEQREAMRAQMSAMEIQMKRRLKKIFRNHKLYVRDAKGGLRRLDKLNRNIYDLIIVYFLNGSGAKTYNLINKDIKSWKDWKAVPFVIEKQYESDFRIVQAVAKMKSFEVMYNGSWRPLVDLSFIGDIKSSTPQLEAKK